jgi:hypothetical protein
MTWRFSTPMPARPIASRGIVIIGRIDSGLHVIANAGGSFQLTIESLD